MQRDITFPFFFHICLYCLKKFIAFSFIHEKQLDETFLVGRWPGDEWARENILISPPLEGAVCSSFTACSSAFQSGACEEQHIQGHGHQAISLPSSIGVFEHNPAPALLPSLINGHIQRHYTCKWRQIVPSLDVAIPLHLVNNCVRAEEAPLSPTIIKKNDVNKAHASDLGIQAPL